MEPNFQERSWSSKDGLDLYFRDYAGPTDKPVVLCMHGLTRNSRDFANLAADLAGDWRVIVPEMRGRGESDYANDSSTYTPATYVEDVFHLLEQEAIPRIVAIGTSMGGIMTMMMASQNPSLIAGSLLNDIGPVVEGTGIKRITEYVGQSRSFASWMQAARALEDAQAVAYPGYILDDWLAMAKRCMSVQQSGRIAFDYDMAIAEPFRTTDGSVPPALWEAFDHLASAPLVVVRGSLSDLLSVETTQAMAARHPDCEIVTIDNIGHAPTLDEPEVREAIGRLLAKIS